MSEFSLYFTFGLEHILDIEGYDHILFVIALCAIYVAKDWKKVLILITAFTIGHSITLALATMEVVNFNKDFIEFLIPVTILLTAIFNIITSDSAIKNSKIQTNYLLAIFFGLIHGLGFSNFLRSILGRDKSIISQLLAFNIGLEVGQIIIVAIFLLISFILVNTLGVNRKYWRIIISAIVGSIAIYLIFNTDFLN